MDRRIAGWLADGFADCLTGRQASGSARLPSKLARTLSQRIPVHDGWCTRAKLCYSVMFHKGNLRHSLRQRLTMQP